MKTITLHNILPKAVLGKSHMASIIVIFYIYYLQRCKEKQKSIIVLKISLNFFFLLTDSIMIAGEEIV